jgi:hypothetical protein
MLISQILITTKGRTMKDKQQFDIDVYFTIRYFADKHGKTITRRAKWTKDCLYGTHKKHGYPYIRYFDVDADGIRCASKSWEILEVAK